MINDNEKLALIKVFKQHLMPKIAYLDGIPRKLLTPDVLQRINLNEVISAHTRLDRILRLKDILMRLGLDGGLSYLRGYGEAYQDLIDNIQQQPDKSLKAILIDCTIPYWQAVEQATSDAFEQWLFTPEAKQQLTLYRERHQSDIMQEYVEYQA